MRVVLQFAFSYTEGALPDNSDEWARRPMQTVIPAKAGIQVGRWRRRVLDSRFRGNDKWESNRFVVQSRRWPVSGRCSSTTCRDVPRLEERLRLITPLPHR